MFDISAVGSEVIITPRGWSPIRITRFSDEGTPFDAPDVDISDNRKNLNGEMISSRTPSVYPVSVTVVPESDEDIELQKLAQRSSLMSGSVSYISNIEIESIVIKVPVINGSQETGAKTRIFTWKNGRMKNTPTGPSTSSEGRLSARTYSFEMEQYAIAGGATVAA